MKTILLVALIGLGAMMLPQSARAQQSQAYIVTDTTIGGRCLDVPNSNYQSGTRLITYRCQSSSNQLFTWDRASKTLRIGGLCVDAFRPGGGASQPGDAVGLWSCHGGANQQWEIRTSNMAPTTIVNLGNGQGNLCLDVANGLNRDGAQLVIWRCQNSPNQFFTPNWIRRLL